MEPEIGDGAAHIIGLFFELNSWRPGGGFGASPITIGLIDDYCRHFGTVVSLYEIELVKKIDLLFLKMASEKDK